MKHKIKFNLWILRALKKPSFFVFSDLIFNFKYLQTAIILCLFGIYYISGISIC